MNNAIKTNYKNMYLIQSKYKKNGEAKTSGGYIGGNSEQDASERHRRTIELMHGTIDNFIVTSISYAGEYETILSQIMNERD